MDKLISQQAAIDALETVKTVKSENGELYIAKINAQMKLEMLPPAQPKRDTGHWVEIGDEPYDEWECDVCGFVIDGSGCIDPEEYKDVYRFCPNCGADMRGETND